MLGLCGKVRAGDTTRLDIMMSKTCLWMKCCAGIIVVSRACLSEMNACCAQPWSDESIITGEKNNFYRMLTSCLVRRETDAGIAIDRYAPCLYHYVWFIEKPSHRALEVFSFKNAIDDG